MKHLYPDPTGKIVPIRRIVTGFSIESMLSRRTELRTAEEFPAILKPFLLLGEGLLPEGPSRTVDQQSEAEERTE